MRIMSKPQGSLPKDHQRVQIHKQKKRAFIYSRSGLGCVSDAAVQTERAQPFIMVEVGDKGVFRIQPDWLTFV